MVTQDNFDISDLIGIPYKRDARGPEAYDCYGLLLEVYRRKGIIMPDLQIPDSPAERHSLALQQLDCWVPCELEAGCGILFKEEGIYQHVGYALDDDSFLHASEKVGQVSISRLSRGWKMFFVGAFRHKNELIKRA